jgi:hypothetical protein
MLSQVRSQGTSLSRVSPITTDRTSSDRTAESVPRTSRAAVGAFWRGLLAMQSFAVANRT